MASPSSILRHLADVLMILVLGVVYVTALSVKTAAAFVGRKLSAVKGSGAGVIRRLRRGPRPRSR